MEEVHENMLAYEVRAAGLSAVQRYAAQVHYEDEYFADLLVNDVLLVERKTVKALGDAHRMKFTNYLKATDLRLCLLFDFGKSCLEIKRVVHGL